MPETIPLDREIPRNIGNDITGARAPTRTGPLAHDAGPRRPPPPIQGLRIVRELGRGGMGEVYEVVDEKLNLTYALKVIRPDRVGQRFLTRFRREARTMAQLDHPHIARIYAYGETEDGPYFTMKYLPDGTLDQRIADYQGEPSKAVASMIEVASAVHYLHTKGFIHRDLKPQNILFLGNQPFVSDFGLAKEQSDLDDGGGYYPGIPIPETDDAVSRADTRVHGSPAIRPHSLTGGVIGTLPYMSPEQLMNVREKISVHTDIWALGVILHELLTGRRPFESDDNEVLSELIKKAEPHPLQHEGSTVDATLDGIVLKCLAKNPEERYATAAEFAAHLQKWLEPPAVAPEPLLTQLPRRRWWRAHPVLTALFAVLLITAVAVPLLLRDPPPPKVLSKTEEEDRQRRLLRETLAAGKPFTIIGEKGEPVTGARFPIVGREGHLEQNVAGHFGLSSVGRCMVELIDDPGVEEYIFRVEVQQGVVANPSDARVGLYFGHQPLIDPAGRMETFAEFSYTEHRLQGKGAALGMHEFTFRQIWQTTGDQERSENSHSNLKWRQSFPHGFVELDYVWRTLSVTVLKNEFRLDWDGQFVRSLPLALPPTWISSMKRFAAGPVLEAMPARAGLGVTVSQGTGMFRNARIEPVPER